MEDKLKAIKNKFEEISKQVSLPEVISDNKRYRALMKEYSTMQPIVDEYNHYSKLKRDLSEDKELLSVEEDADMKDMLKTEIEDLKQQIEKSEEDIKFLLLPKDENDDKNVIVEIRPGAGGDEASLFGGVLLKMYLKYAEKKRWKSEIVSISDTELGGIKEATFKITGKGVYSDLKFESGVHRVQRVPETESQGRIHTSTATVAVLPEREDIELDIEDKELRIDIYRSSGAGGQHVNTTDSAVRITHLPTGIVVACQNERSQIQNRESAMSILKSKLYDYYQTKADKAYAENRKAQVGSGDRSERIRTYNYPQGRMTDHRINYTSYNLQDFLDGDLEDLINTLKIAEREYKLAHAE